jgi:hypothetical protein
LAADDGHELQPPASATNIEQVEAQLGAVVPAGLRALYQTSNAVYDKPGEWFVVWPLDAVVERNHHAWAVEDRARQQLLGFGDDGTGTAFCVPRDGAPGVFVWNTIDRQVHRIADTLEEFWSRWSNGQITT